MFDGLGKMFDGFGKTVSDAGSSLSTSIGSATSSLSTNVSTAAASWSTQTSVAAATASTELATGGAISSASLTTGGATTASELVAGGATAASSMAAGGAGSGISSAIGGGGASSGISSFFASLFNAKGNSFDGGSVIPYAKGGAFTNQVIDAATRFPMRGGKTGVMGEAGPEAIMPLVHSVNGALGVRIAGGGSLPLTRDSSGSLAVLMAGGNDNQMFATGGVFGGNLAQQTANVTPISSYRAQSAEAVNARANVTHNAGGLTITNHFSFEGGATQEAAAQFSQTMHEVGAAMARQEIQKNRPVAARDATDAVRRRHIDNPTYLAR